MSELFPILMILFIWAVASSSKKKGTSRKKPLDPRMQRRVSPRSGNVSRDSNHSPDTASRQQADDQVSEEAHQPIQPTVRITPHDHSGMFEGSMEADREEYARQDMPSAVSETFFVEEEQTEAPAASPLLPIMNTDSLKRGFIMHEILTRPVDRHR